MTVSSFLAETSVPIGLPGLTEEKVPATKSGQSRCANHPDLMAGTFFLFLGPLACSPRQKPRGVPWSGHSAPYANIPRHSSIGRLPEDLCRGRSGRSTGNREPAALVTGGVPDVFAGRGRRDRHNRRPKPLVRADCTGWRLTPKRSVDTY